MDFYVKESYALAIDDWTKTLEILLNDPKVISWIEKAKQKLQEKSQLKLQEEKEIKP